MEVHAVHDDVESIIDEDNYFISEALKGDYFHYDKYYDDFRYIPRVTMVVILFTTGWESGSVNPFSRCNA